ncbi:hypothetical protein GGI24_004423, partial [Coemansia furcata]
MSRRHVQLDAEDGEITDPASSLHPTKVMSDVARNGSKPAASVASSSKRDYARSRSRSRSPNASRYADRRSNERHGDYSRHVSRNRSRSPRQSDHKSRRDDKVARANTNEPNVSMPSLTYVAQADDSVPLYFEYEDEEAETERLLEARRRRRREILQMHEAQNPAQSASVADVENLSIIDNDTGDQRTGSSASPSTELVLEKKGIVDINAANSSTSSNNDLPAADYSPNADINADDMRHRIAAQAMAMAS